FLIAACACSLACLIMSLSTQSQFSKAKLRFKPGAILHPIKAASIGIVPEPHTGSTNGISGYQRANRTNAAAIFSFRGAPPLFTLYPRLNKLLPVVSNVIKTLSLLIATSIGYNAPVSGNLVLL